MRRMQDLAVEARIVMMETAAQYSGLDMRTQDGTEGGEDSKMESKIT